MLDLWLAWRPGGMGSAGHLPFAGGAAQQPSALMRAFEAMSGAELRLREKAKERRGD